jgi:4-diphosphocytidyl-2-C-methyl-D-erythritol kinase
LTQNWQVTKTLSGRYFARVTRFYNTDITRLFGLFNDPDSWTMEAPERLLRLVPDSEISYSFDDGSRVVIRFSRIRYGLVRLELEHDLLETAEDLEACCAYWDEIMSEAHSRLLCEPVHAAVASGKINLFFKVGPLQEDGYHQVSSLYQSVNLNETVVVEPATKWGVTVVGSLAQEQLDSVPTGSGNLVVKAAKATADYLQFENVPKLHITIYKEVPVAGGMGGGSADAAAAIIACESLWQKQLTKTARLECAASLGADVPFALNGGAAVGTGVGDKLRAIKQKSVLHWAIVPRTDGLSTPAVYKELDRLRAAAEQDPRAVGKASMSSELVQALESGATAEEIAPLLHNDLQEAAVSLLPELQDVLDLADKVYALRAIVSGSGPTIAMLARDERDAIAIASRLNTYGHPAIVTSSPAGSASLAN